MMTQITERSIAFGGEAFPDRRSEQRRRIFKGAVLRFDGGYGSRECVVRSMSEPARFEMRISDHAAFRPVEVCWRRGGDVGVRLVQP
jgi:hypothetical protein